MSIMTKPLHRTADVADFYGLDLDTFKSRVSALRAHHLLDSAPPGSLGRAPIEGRPTLTGRDVEILHAYVMMLRAGMTGISGVGQTLIAFASGGPQADVLAWVKTNGWPGKMLAYVWTPEHETQTHTITGDQSTIAGLIRDGRPMMLFGGGDVYPGVDRG